jgi:hypothetical protein
MRRTVRGAGALVAAGALVIGLGACSDGDDDEAATGSDSSEALAADGGGDAAAFCSAATDVDQVSLGLEAGESTPEDMEAAMQAALDIAPTAITAQVTTLVDESKAMMAAEETADPEGPPPLPSDEYMAAAGEVGAYLSAECGYETLDVETQNYSFAGIPHEVPAGTTVINVTNDATEIHELILVKVADGETRSVEELMALPEEEVEQLITDKAFVFAMPGGTNFVTAELDPGRYVALCFVPVGATPEALASGTPVDDSNPHAMNGMVQEFTVS